MPISVATLNRVNIPGKPIDEAEKTFAKIEGEIARVLKEIAEKATLPKGTDMETLIYFVAFTLHAQSPNPQQPSKH